MPKKLALAQVAEVLKKHKVAPKLLRAIVEDLNTLVLESESDSAEAVGAAARRQYVVVLSDATGRIRERVDTNNLVAWVVQIPDNASPFSTMERVFRGAYDFNASKRGRLLPVKSVGEAMESVPARIFKEAEIAVRTKLPVACVVTDNQIPRSDVPASPLELERVSIKVDGVEVFDSRKGKLQPAEVTA